MRKNPDPLERDIEKAVVAFAKAKGVLVYKFTSPSQRSVPDRLFILPGGRGILMVEFKRKGCVPTAAQEIEISKIRKQGIYVAVADNIEDGKRAIEHCLDPMF